MALCVRQKHTDPKKEAQNKVIIYINLLKYGWIISSKRDTKKQLLSQKSHPNFKSWRFEFKSFKHIIVFREEGFSGDDYNVNEESLIKRKLLPIILSNIKLFKHIWVIDTNRLGRSVQIISYLTIEFSKHNISLYVNGVLRNLNEMGDKFLIQLMGLVDEIENEKPHSRRSAALSS